MTRLILALLITVLVGIVPALALDLEVYGCKIFNARNYGLAASGNPGYVAGVSAKEDFLWDHLSPYLKIETLMDSKRVDNSLAIADGFHPTSVAYTAGLDLYVYSGFGVRAEHMCHHSIGSDPYARGTEQYTSLTMYYRIHADVK